MQELAVIIGRFQINHLTAGHIDFVNKVLDINRNLLILLGTSPTRGQRENALSFEMRKQMFEKLYPNELLLFREIKDVGDDEVWSRNLDEIIDNTCAIYECETAKVYGSRDSFISHYSGKFEAVDVPHRFTESATAMRQKICATTTFTDDFRAGVIRAAYDNYPTTYPTVDVAIVSETKVLLGRKPNQKKFRFVGGFAEPDSDCYEDDGIREGQEETGTIISNLVYIGSKKIKDWRYERGVNKIKTLFFIAKYESGEAKAADDLAEIRWFNIAELSKDDIVDEHFPLLEMFQSWLLQQKNAQTIAELFGPTSRWQLQK